ncbi:hypothetical protein TNCV_1060211 [Trichonephila clavipes]|nr:hypothetical protein TNCV_1060211 [Trichonephila clavipes]
MKIPAQLSTNWENFRFLLKNKPLPIPASPSDEHLDVAIGRLGENISEALVAASKTNLKPYLLNYLRIFAPKFATEIGYGDFGKDLETLLLKMNSVLSATRSPVISDISPVQDGRKQLSYLPKQALFGGEPSFSKSLFITFPP